MKAAFAPTILALLSLVTVRVTAQTAPVKDSAEDAVVLSPFSVTETRDTGYSATNSISATRFASNIRELPISIQVVTENFLQDLAQNGLENMLAYVSGTRSGDRNLDSARANVFVLRGFKTTSIFRNGVRVDLITDPAVIQRIEVVKGPTALYGTTDPGGMVNYVTKRPEPTRSASLHAELGSYEHRRVSLDVNQPLSSDGRLLARYIGSYEKSESDQPFVNLEAHFHNPTFTWQPFARTRFTADYSRVERRGIPVRNPNPFLRDPVFTTVFIGFVPVPRDFTTTTPTDTYKQTNSVLEFSGEQTINDHLTARVSWARTMVDYDLFNVITGAASSPNPPYPFTRAPSLEQRERDQKTLQMNLLAQFRTGAVAHKMLLGAQRDWDFSTQIRRELRPGSPFFPAPVNLVPPGPGLFTNATRAQLEADAVFRNNNIDDSRVSTIFLTDQASFWENRVHVLGGVRRTELEPLGVSHTDPQGGVNVRVSKPVTLFAGYSTGFRGNGTDDNGALFPPEESAAYEVGAKVDLFDGRITGSVAAFDIRKRNIVNVDGSASVFNAQNPTLPPRPTRTISGEETSEGFNVDLILAPVPHWQTILAYEYIDARVTESPLQRLPNDPAANAQGLVDVVGLPLEGAAKNSASVWTSYELQQGRFKGLKFGGGFFWKQGPIKLFPVFANRFVTQPDDYVQVDAFVRYRTRLFDRTAVIGANVSNLTNELYYRARGQFAAPRTFKLSVELEL